MLKKAFQILTESSSPPDTYFTYGQHIANELRKYDQRTLVYVQQAINNVIFEADLGKYTHYEGNTHNYGQTHYNTSHSSTPSHSPSPQPSLSSPQPPISPLQFLIPSPSHPLTVARQTTIQSLQPPTVLSPLPLQSSSSDIPFRRR
ncbi:unnamed protein product [Ceutorhynchus assimilis]|uniref:Uncharacterized protein n=1 Tax=Ceutorhynchus assimilis TaxID=467358 RepID=A0A9N9MLE2_9CUCU|nr:unnamed protein product [Ceutorhynchus assimilis]